MKNFSFLIATLALLILPTISFHAEENIQSENRPKAKLILDQSLFKRPDGVTSAWIVYGGARLLWIDEKFWEENPDAKAYRYSYAEEFEARKILVDMWEEFKDKHPRKSDSYLDSLLRVKKAGFLSEYVWVFFKSPEWGDAPATLKLNEFEEWRKKELKDHQPETLAATVAEKEEDNNQ